MGSRDGTRTSDTRDLAILLLLARLGLRSIEIARLQLGELDWPSAELLVRGKTGRIDRMPLPVEVGEAMVEYLRHGRPESTDRNVFLTERAPRIPIPPDHVAEVVRRTSRRSGVPVVGTPRLRHSLATDMLAKGVP